MTTPCKQQRRCGSASLCEFESAFTSTEKSYAAEVVTAESILWE